MFLTENPPVPAVENAIFILSKIPIPPNRSKTNRIIVSNIYIVYKYIAVCFIDDTTLPKYGPGTSALAI